jgi:hypothetical protein
LDKNSLRYIIDIARPSKKFEDIKTQMDSDYKVNRGNGWQQLIGPNGNLIYDRESAELLLPYID